MTEGVQAVSKTAYSIIAKQQRPILISFLLYNKPNREITFSKMFTYFLYWAIVESMIWILKRKKLTVEILMG